jgi:DinB superfamily
MRQPMTNVTNGYTNLSLSEILAEAEAISHDAQAIFGTLTSQQIDWKPSAGSWSVGQCLDHLIAGNSSYFPQIDQIIRGEPRAWLWQNIPFLSGFWGRMLIKVLDPTSMKKYKAPKSFQPSASKIDPQIVSSFAANHKELIEKIKATQGMDLDKVIIYSPAIKIITYSLFDAYRAIVAHERRHFKQAERVMKSPGFPM